MPVTPRNQAVLPTLTGPLGCPGRERTRHGFACLAAVALLALIVLIMQNLLVEVSFLGWHGQFPLVVALLAAALIVPSSS